jgi:hypothetical protein
MANDLINHAYIIKLPKAPKRTGFREPADEEHVGACKKVNKNTLCGGWCIPTPWGQKLQCWDSSSSCPLYLFIWSLFISFKLFFIN